MLISDFRGGRGEELGLLCWLRKKRYFTQKFAYVYGKYAKLKIRIPDPRPKHIPCAHMELRREYLHKVFAQNRREHYFTRTAAQGRGGSRGLRPFRRGRARKRTGSAALSLNAFQVQIRSVLCSFSQKVLTPNAYLEWNIVYKSLGISSSLSERHLLSKGLSWGHAGIFFFYAGTVLTAYTRRRVDVGPCAIPRLSSSSSSMYIARGSAKYCI